jgi:hypothetical protein
MKVAYNNCHGGFAISMECGEWLANRGNKECIENLERYKETGTWHDSLFDTPRHDALLIMAIEELGKKANGYCASLRLHELKGDRYKIDEYDGAEDVVEPNDIGWVKV